MKNKISVIVPAHNEESYLEKTLKSLKENNLPFELIVVCDSCSDSTESIARKYSKKVFSVNFENISKTRNFGAEKSTGNILIFNDADTIVSGNYLSEISNTMNNYDYGCAKWKSESGNPLGRFIAFNNNRYNKTHKTISGNSFVKKDLFQKLRGYNERMIKGEDTDLGDRLRKFGSKHIFIDKIFYIPSERKYQKEGYLNLIFKSQKEGILYLFNREKYKRKFRAT